jgi:putative acetyltransferase
MTESEIAIEHVPTPTAEAATLIAELDAVLGALYEPEQRHGLSVEQVFQPNVRFFIARIGDAAVGCGAIALFGDYAEVKRMYTRESARGRGVGRAVLARLEDAATGRRKTAAAPGDGNPPAGSDPSLRAMWLSASRRPIWSLRGVAAASHRDQRVLREATLERSSEGTRRVIPRFVRSGRLLAA